MDWVIDTDVLVRADNLGNGHDHWSNVMDLLSSMDRLGHSLVVDYEHKILGQYYSNLTRHGWIIKLLGKFSTRGRIRFVSGGLSDSTYTGLRTRGFHDDDDVFVAVTSNSSSGLLVAEESDYSQPVVEFLLERGIRVVDCAFASAGVNRKAP